MNDVICPCCGSEDLKDEVVKRTYKPPFGAPEPYEIVIQRCQTCHEAGDFKRANPPIIKEIIKTANRRVILSIFSGKSKKKKEGGEKL